MRIAIIAALLLSAACSTTSTIRYRDGTEEELNLVGGNDDVVVARSSRQDTVIPRDEIADIDYPGNGAGTTGLLLSLYGLPNGILAIDYCQDLDAGAACYIFGWSPLVIGVPLMIEGYSRWADAKKRAARSTSNRRRHEAPHLDERPDPPQVNIDEIPLACHALIRRDRTGLVGYATAASVEPECELVLETKKRAPFQNEILRIERFSGKPDSAKLVVRDLAGAVWTSPCICLSPK